MTLGRKIILGVVAVLAIVYGAVVYFVLPTYLEKLRPDIAAISTEYINGTVAIESVEGTGGLGLKAKGITVRDAKGETVITIDALTAEYSLWRALLNRDLVGGVYSVGVDTPSVLVTLDKENKCNLEHLLRPSEGENTSFRAKVHVRNGSYTFVAPYGKWEGGFQGEVDASANPKYALDADLSYLDTNISVTGLIDSEARGSLVFKSSDVSLGDFASLIAHFAPLKAVSGRVRNIALRWENTGKQVELTGQLYCAKMGAKLSYEGREIPLALNGKVLFAQRAVFGKDLLLTVAGGEAKINGGVDLADSAKPLLDDLALELEDIELGTLLGTKKLAGKVSGNVTLSGAIKELNIQSKLTCPLLTYEQYTLKDVVLPVTMQGSEIVVAAAGAGVAGGTLSLTGSYDKKTYNFKAVVASHGADIAQLAARHDQVVVDGQLALKGVWSEKERAVEALGNFPHLHWHGQGFHDIALYIDAIGDEVKIRNISGFSDNGGSFLVRGKITDGVWQAKGRIANLPITPLLCYTDLTGEGNFSTGFTITGPTEKLCIKGMTAFTSGKLLEQEIKDAHGFVELNGTILSLRKFNITLPQGGHVVNGSIELGGAEPVLAFNIVTQNVRMDPMSDYYDPTLQLTGNLDNTVVVKGPLSNLHVVGTLHAYDGSFHKYLVDDATCHYEYRNGNLMLNGVKIKTLTTSATGSGTLDKAGQLNFAIAAKAVRLKRIANLFNITADLDGNLDFQGKVRGTVKQPHFTGEVTAQEISVNGEKLNALRFAVESAGGKENSFQGTFAQASGGTCSAVIYHNGGDKVFRGNLEIVAGDVPSILRALKEDFNVDGKLYGTIKIDVNGLARDTLVKGRIDGAHIGKIAFSEAELDAKGHNAVWTINTLKAVETGGGVMQGQGVWKRKTREIDFSLTGQNVTGAILTAYMKNPLPCTGNLNFTATLSGTLDKPKGQLTAILDKGSIASVPFDRLEGIVSLKDDTCTIDKFTLSHGACQTDVTGKMPLDLVRTKAERRNKNAVMDIAICLDNENLNILQTKMGLVEKADGSFKGKVHLGGTLEDPLITGNIDIAQGYVKFRNVLSPLEQINFSAIFQGKEVLVPVCSAKMGDAGSIKAEGRYSFANTQEEAPYALNFVIDKVQVRSAPFTSTINSTGNITHKKGRPHLTLTARFDDALLNILSVPEMGDSQTNVGLNVQLTLGPKVHMYNKYFYDVYLGGGLTIEGSTGFPVISGDIRALKGSIRYLRNDFEIKEGSISFPQKGSFVPSLNFKADTTFRSYNITCSYRGEVSSAMDIELTSVPERTKNEIFRMLTFASEGTSSSLGNDDVHGLLDAGLGMMFFGEVEDAIERTLGLTEFRLYSGSLRNGLGFSANSFSNLSKSNADAKKDMQYNFLLSKRIGKDLLLGYTQSISRAERSIYAQYNLSSKYSATFSRDERNKHWYGLQYKIQF